MRLKFQPSGRGKAHVGTGALACPAAVICAAAPFIFFHHRVTEAQRTPKPTKPRRPRGYCRVLGANIFFVPLWPVTMLAGRKGMP
jgi:hypothetical protein